jgi:transposase
LNSFGLNLSALSHWRLAAARIIGGERSKLGHTVRLIPPAYVKPFVKRQKNDAADAEAICEAAQRPSMRFVAVKDEEQQASGVVFRARDVLVRQHTQCINALRGHLMEYGWVVPKGATHVSKLIDQIEDPNCHLPQSARVILKVLITTLKSLEENIAVLDVEIARRAKEDPVARRLMTIPGVGPITATAIVALAPPVETFRTARDLVLSALVPASITGSMKDKIFQAACNTLKTVAVRRRKWNLR